MTFSLLPSEIINEIISYDFKTPINNCRNELTSFARALLNLSLTNKRLMNICSNNLTETKRKFEIVTKYFIKQTKYEENCLKINNIVIPCPHLCDALLTGIENSFKSPFFKTTAKSSQLEYTEEVEKDIRDILLLMPQSLDYIYVNKFLKIDSNSQEINEELDSIAGTERYNSLTIACLNPAISLDIIKEMINIKNGNNINYKIIRKQDGIKMFNLTDFISLKLSNDSKRLNEILSLLKK